MDCNSLRELLEAYALGALERDEQERVQQHLASCADCRRLAEEYASSAHALADALSVASPLSLPQDAKARLLEAVEAEGQIQRPSAGADESPGRKERRGHPAARWPSLWRPRALAVAAALVLLALSVAWGASVQVALGKERAQRNQLASLVGQQEVVLEVVDSDKTVKLFLRPPAPGSTSYGKLYTRPDMPYVVVMSGRLSPPPEGQAYHAWATFQGETRPLGTLTVNSEGFGLLVTQAEQNGPTYDSVQVVLQPEGSDSPSGTPALVWQAPPKG